MDGCFRKHIPEFIEIVEVMEINEILSLDVEFWKVPESSLHHEKSWKIMKF